MTRMKLGKKLLVAGMDRACISRPKAHDGAPLVMRRAGLSG